MNKKTMLTVTILTVIFGIFFLGMLQAKSEPPVENYPLDGIPLSGTLQAEEDKKLCSLLVIHCADEAENEQRIQAISELVAGTHFAGHERAILEATQTYGVNPKLFVGIANAESSVGEHCKWNNCFGIMIGKGQLKSYPSLDDGIIDAARTIRTGYHDRGLFTPEQMVNRYVGHPAPHWLINVNTYYLR